MPRRPNPGVDTHIDQYYPVLDHGFLSLVDVMGDDESIEQAARVSYGKGTRAKSKTRDLLRYLYRHKHTTPFEMVEFKFHMAMPMFVARQWIRHRTASVNEYSGRYSILPNAYYVPEEWRTQSKKNNQGSSAVVLGDEKHDKANYYASSVMKDAFQTYDWLDSEGVARELSRIVLPVAAYTQWYWKIDLHNLLHFLKLRTDPHAQWEIRVFANYMAGIVRDVVPLAFEAWEDYSRDAITLSAEEQRVLGSILRKGEVDLDESELSSRERDEFIAKFDRMVEGWEDTDDFILPNPITPAEAYERFFPGESFEEDK